VGYNGRGFFPLLDITEEFFSAVGYNGEGFPPLWDTTEEDIFREKNLRMANNFFPMEPTTQDILLPLYPTMEDIFLHCGIQRKRFFSVVGYNRRGFFHFGIQWKRFFSVVGYNGKKFYNAE
jgi:hypothetical protein